MDYRKFLQRSEERVLPYFGGTGVQDVGRRLTVMEVMAPGWYLTRIEGRAATLLGPADPPDLSASPCVRGHFALGWLFRGGREIDRIELLPEEELAPLTPLVTRRWHSGELLFESSDFEGEAEEEARRALEDRRSLAQLSGVAASLRAAFGFALSAHVAAERQLRISPREVMGSVLSIAASGVPAVTALLDRIAEARELERVRLEAWQRSEGLFVPHAAPPEPAPQGTSERVARALERAEASLLSQRSLGIGQLEVAYRFMGQRFISVVDERTLRVIDAGICLSGHDGDLTLESLPGVIREGYETDQLNITRW